MSNDVRGTILVVTIVVLFVAGALTFRFLRDKADEEKDYALPQYKILTLCNAVGDTLYEVQQKGMKLRYDGSRYYAYYTALEWSRPEKYRYRTRRVAQDLVDSLTVRDNQQKARAFRVISE
jgi:hypothetical protein